MYYELGQISALVKLGATDLMQPLSPEAKAFMQRRTGFGTPAPLFGELSQSQMQLRNALDKLPLIGEKYERYVADMSPAARQRAVDQFLANSGRIHAMTPEARALSKASVPMAFAPTIADTSAGVTKNILGRLAKTIR